MDIQILRNAIIRTNGEIHHLTTLIEECKRWRWNDVEERYWNKRQMLIKRSLHWTSILDEFLAL